MEARYQLRQSPFYRGRAARPASLTDPTFDAPVGLIPLARELLRDLVRAGCAHLLPPNSRLSCSSQVSRRRWRGPRVL
jgi:hypothetical protein